MKSFLALVLLAVAAMGQARPPIVLLNGYQGQCDVGSPSSVVFGKMQDLLTAQGLTVYYFDNCTAKASGSGRPTIEDIGQAFGQFLGGLGVPQVDVVGHSMGGLIIRTYLEGLLPSGKFAPPAVPGIRKAVLIGTPHFGALMESYLFATSPVDAQLEELLPGSAFEWALNTGNQGTYDFRGIDAIAVAGDAAGTTDIPADGAQGTSDGAVPLTSAGIVGFLGPDRVRVLQACHVRGLPSFICVGPALAWVDSDSHDGYRIVNSFLAGTDDWKSIGHSPAQDPVLSKYGGVDIAVADSNGNIFKSPRSMVAKQGDLLGNSGSGVFFGDLLPAGAYNFIVSGAGSGDPGQAPMTALPGVHREVLAKTGPRIDSIQAAAGPLQTLSRAPGMMVSIYGAALSGATVTVGAQPATILFSADSQINAVLPDSIGGVVPFTVSTASGSHTVNLFVESAVPALFSADGSGTGAALAFHANGALVSAANPAVAGETISLEATGLGSPSPAVPAVTIGGQAVKVVASVNVGSGVDRVDVVAPPLAGSALPLVISAGVFTSNALAIAVAGN